MMVGYAQQTGASISALVLAALVSALPMTDVAIAFVQRVVTWMVKPRRLLRLDFLDGVPANARTMVIVPTLLTSVDGVAELMDHLAVLAFANLDKHVHFAILSDFADADSRERPEDAAILSAARSGIESLGARIGPEHRDRFFLFHRDRQWNEQQQVWMGWERKRGKIEEFNALLRGDGGTSFTVQTAISACFRSRGLLHHADSAPGCR